jgi:hypothetical protein
MPELTPEPDSTGGESKKKKKLSLSFFIYLSFKLFLNIKSTFFKL